MIRRRLLVFAFAFGIDIGIEIRIRFRIRIRFHLPLAWFFLSPHLMFTLHSLFLVPSLPSTHLRFVFVSLLNATTMLRIEILHAMGCLRNSSAHCCSSLAPCSACICPSSHSHTRGHSLYHERDMRIEDHRKLGRKVRERYENMDDDVGASDNSGNDQQ